MVTAESPSKSLSLTVLAAVAIAATVWAVFMTAAEVVLLSFLGLLLGVFLSRLAGVLADHLSLNYSVALAVVMLSLSVFSCGAAMWCGALVNDEIDDVDKRLSNVVRDLQKRAQRNAALQMAVHSSPLPQIFEEKILATPSSNSSSSSSEQDQESSPEQENSSSGTSPTEAGSTPSYATLGKVIGVFGRLFATTFGVTTNTIFVGFCGLFIAAAPATYAQGVLQLVPPARRDRYAVVLNEVADTMWRWILGRLLAMLVTGGGTAVVLLMLDVPLAIPLGFITAVLTFIPNIGAIISLVLAVLVAMPSGGDVVAWVVVLYVVLQLLESNVLTPLVQQRQVHLAPALLIAFQLLMAAMLGFLGVLVATPLLATASVFVRRLYIEDVLGDDTGDAAGDDAAGDDAAGDDSRDHEMR